MKSPLTPMNLCRYIILIFLALPACSVLQKTNNLPAAPPTPEELKLSKQLLAENKFPEVVALLEPYKRSLRGATDGTKLTLYRLGRGYEGLGRWKDAIQTYRELLNLSLKNDPRDHVEVLYRLVFCYEADGNDTMVLTTLKDLELRKRYLPRDVAEVEIPARYSKVYTRLGDLTNAERYLLQYQTALKGAATKSKSNLKKSNEVVPSISEAQSPPEIPPLEEPTASRPQAPLLNPDGDVQLGIPRLLFNIGQLSIRKVTREELKRGHPALGQSQVFLFQAVVANDPEWSQRAVTEIAQIYRDALDVIQNTPLEVTEDPLIGQTAQQNEKKELASMLAQHVIALHGLNEKVTKSNAYIESLFSQLATVDDALAAIQNERPVSEGLTEEARKREGIKREGEIKESHP